MTFTFKKGRHRARPLYWLVWFPIMFWRKSVVRVVNFDFSCKYDLPGTSDDEDINKLFGVSFLLPHRNSARFGWHFDQELQKIVISSYTYKNRVLNKYGLCPVEFNRDYILEISWYGPMFNYKVFDKESGKLISWDYQAIGFKCFISLLLGPYFGGNKKSTHDMKAKLKKL